MTRHSKNIFDVAISVTICVFIVGFLSFEALVKYGPQVAFVYAVVFGGICIGLIVLTLISLV